jgi:hypothetical protein
MRIGIVGGTDKNRSRYEELASSLNCQVEFHDGYMRGTAGSALQSLVARVDLVVIVTQVNSHRAVLLARELTRKHGRRPLIVRRFGLRHLREVACAHAPSQRGGAAA